MNLTDPVESEKNEVLRFIKDIRRTDIILGVVLLLIFLIPIVIGILMIIDKNYYGISPIVIFGFVMLVPFGLFLSDLDRQKLIKEGRYSVARGKVESRDAAAASRYRNTYYITVRLDDGTTRRFKSSQKMYFRAKEGRKALIVCYRKENEEDKSLPADVIVLKDIDQE